MLFPNFLLDDLLNDSFVPMDNKSRVEKTDKGYDVKIALPGVDSKNISVELDPTVNRISVEVENGSDFIHHFKRSYEIPQSVDLDTIETSVELGVLTISMSRKSESARRKLM